MKIYIFIIAIIIVILIVIVGGVLFFGKKPNHLINSCPTAPRICADGTQINLAMPNCNQGCPEDKNIGR